MRDPQSLILNYSEEFVSMNGVEFCSTYHI
jgi:hypothetical protein